MESCDRFHFSPSSYSEEEGEVILLNLLFDAILITVGLIRRRKIPEQEEGGGCSVCITWERSLTLPRGERTEVDCDWLRDSSLVGEQQSICIPFSWIQPWSWWPTLRRPSQPHISDEAPEGASASEVKAACCCFLLKRCCVSEPALCTNGLRRSPGSYRLPCDAGQTVSLLTGYTPSLSTGKPVSKPCPLFCLSFYCFLPSSLSSGRDDLLVISVGKQNWTFTNE